MVVILFFLLAITLCGTTICSPNQFNNEYMSKHNTACINGIFVVLVFFRHFTQYITLTDSLGDSLYYEFNGYLGQLLVTSFLFYSGYGIMCSIQAKREPYVNAIPRKRISGVWLHFAIAVILFLVCDLILGKNYDIKTILLAFTGWSSIGNSNWYIFATLFLYLFVFIAFKISKSHNIIGLTITSVLILAFVFILMRLDRPQYCFNTVACYPLGMLFALTKPKIEKFLFYNDITYSITLLVVFSLFILSFKFIREGFICHSICSMLFIILVVIISAKVKLNNGFLTLMGNHVFSIYILQRIPMMILANLGLNKDVYVFLLLSFLATISLALIFDKLMVPVDKKLKIK
ncbi:MAG: transcriptional regulator [Clostridia bacterium]|nr:transcriptional regulator [Clostridia bacterium]